MSQRVRTLIVDLSARFGGASSRVLGLLQGMQPDEAALASLAGSPVTDQAIDCGFPVHTVGSHKLDPRIGRHLAALVREKGFHVVDAQNPQSKLWASRAAARTPCALVSTLNSWYLSEHGGNLKGRFYHALEQGTSGKLDLYIAVSQEIGGQLLESGVPAGRVAVVENAILLEPDAIDGDPTWLRRTFQLPDEAYVISAVGRLVEIKGFEFLIRSVKELHEHDRRLYCLIVGEGEVRDKLARQIARLGLQEHIRLVGLRSRNEVLSIVKAADLFVMPSLSEGTPVALLEAAALAKPIVASDVGGIPTMLTSEVHALLTEPKGVSSLTAAISRLMSDREQAAELGRRARQRVLSDFSLEAQVQATRQAYAVALRHAAKRLRMPHLVSACDAAEGAPAQAAPRNCQTG